jgi:minor extracellular serine protease Vpr
VPNSHCGARARSFRRRALLTGALAALAALSITSAGVASRNPVEAPATGQVSAVTKPLGLSSKQVTVILQLSGDPVAVVEGDQGRKLSPAEKKQVKAPLKAKQDAIVPQIQQLGGQVLAQYQSAYNGIKVQIDARQVGALLGLPNVIDVNRVIPVKPDLTESIPYLGVPQVWDGVNGLHGEGVKVAVIDTGLDYTNADFGASAGTCPGYVDFATAFANSTVDPALLGVPSCEFGANARVKGGFDFVGDDYNADPNDPAYQPIPHPDPNPLDCNGHGSHVAGIAGGGGITDAGDPYSGPYTSSLDFSSFRVGPGVAPKVDLYGLRVFGCEGSSDVVLDAIDWAVDHDMDVINMSLGSTFGGPKAPDAVASTNAAKAGIIVVASAGNEGSSPYMTGSPASGTGAISVAANDSHETFPGVSVAFGTGTTLDAVNANEFDFPDGQHFDHVVVLSGANVLGCSVDDFGGPNSLPPNTLAIATRGTCARVAKAIFGQQAGAAAVGMINNAPGFPPIEGEIFSNPDTGEPFHVTIPFLGFKGSDAAAVQAQDGSTATITHNALANPTFSNFASFSSYGPRTGDSGLKPDITAPGVSIVSAGSGTGNGGATISGTSQASPHVAGVAALVRQADPDWKKVELWKAAIVNTGNAAAVGNFSIRGGGTGLVQPVAATKTQVVAIGDKDTGSLSFDIQELKKDFDGHAHITLRNLGSSSATFNVGTAFDSGVPHSISLGASQVTVKAHTDKDIDVRLSVPASSVPPVDPSDVLSYYDASGFVTFTPVGGSNNGVSLTVPWGITPRSLSDIGSKVAGNKLGADGTPSTLTISNGKKAPAAGTADFYAWGVEGKKDKGFAAADVRAVGVQSFPFPSGADPGRQLLVFAANTFQRWSSPSTQEFDIFVDVNGDNSPDYDVVGVDFGAVTAGSFDGLPGAFVFDLRTGEGTVNFLATAPTDGSTEEIPILSSQLCRPDSPCLNQANPRFTYQVVSFDLYTGAADEVPGTGSYNPWTPAISQGLFDVLPPGASAQEQVSVDPTEFAQTPALGSMVVSLDNEAGDQEAQLIPVGK